MMVSLLNSIDFLILIMLLLFGFARVAQLRPLLKCFLLYSIEDGYFSSLRFNCCSLILFLIRNS